MDRHKVRVSPGYPDRPHHPLNLPQHHHPASLVAPSLAHNLPTFCMYRSLALILNSKCKPHHPYLPPERVLLSCWGDKPWELPCLALSQRACRGEGHGSHGLGLPGSSAVSQQPVTARYGI